MRIICQQMILMKYHALLVTFEKAEKFEIGIFPQKYQERYHYMGKHVHSFPDSLAEALTK